MITGLMHGHSGMGQLLMVVVLINIAFALSASKNPLGLAKIMRLCHMFFLMVGRLNIILGIILAIILSKNLLTEWQYVASIFLWGGVEVSSKRLVQPELQSISDGIAATKNLLLGFFAELIVMTLIFLCMYYK